MDRIRCEDERIHLMGLVQQVGFLIVLDEQQHILAYSENCGSAANLFKEKKILGSPIGEMLHAEQHALAKELHQLSSKSMDYSSLRIEINTLIDHAPHLVKVYGHDNKIYVEIERLSDNQLEYARLLGADFIRLQRAESILWKTLSETISNILAYDRVMIYQFLEDGSGVVVGEQLASSALDSYMGMNYPEFDIPKQARELYTRFHCRFVADTEADASPLISNSEEPIDLSATEIRSLSPVHMQYLRNAGAPSSMSFSIIVEGRLWGLVCCQHTEAKHPDAPKRNFCLMLTNYAALLFKQSLDKKRLGFIEESRDLELKLKENILLNNNLFKELQNAAAALCGFMDADGFAVMQDKAIFLYGNTPSKGEIREIDQHIEAYTQESCFFTHVFPKGLENDFPKTVVAFPGLARIDIQWDKKLSVWWFRKELTQRRQWAGKPEKHYVLDNTQNKFFPSPRASFEKWTEEVTGTSKPWGEREVHFLNRLHSLLMESIVHKSAEIFKLNQQLIELNNALDTYSYTISHDLQNPLAAVKLSAQMLHQKENLPDSMVKRLAENILNSLDVIQDMLVKVHEFSKANNYEFEGETIALEDLVHEISMNCKERFECQNTEIRLGKLLPVFGEKTLIYQLLINIIGNAVKYSSKVPHPIVTIESSPEESGIRYSVRDNGIGIDESELHSIFEIFKRMSNSSGFTGSGVGMAIVKRIADRMGIRIDIASKLNEGTSVELLFPPPKHTNYSMEKYAK